MQSMVDFFKIQTGTKPVIHGGDENRVTVRIWRGGTAYSSAGHVSVQTYIGGSTGKGVYASFWPSDVDKRKSQLSLAGVEGAHNTLRQDIVDERRAPDDIINLYTLDARRVSVEYEEFARCGCNWSVWGGKSALRANAPKHCSGLALFLLMHGRTVDIPPTMEYHASLWRAYYRDIYPQQYTGPWGFYRDGIARLQADEVKFEHSKPSRMDRFLRGVVEFGWSQAYPSMWVWKIITEQTTTVLL